MALTKLTSVDKSVAKKLIANINAVKNKPTLDVAVAATNLVVGDAINVAERTTGNGGGAMWDAVLSSSVTENTYNIVQCTGVPTLSLVLRSSEAPTVVAFGAIGDGITDDTVAIQAYYDSDIVNLSLVVGDFKISDTVVLRRGKNLDFDGGVLVYTGPTDRPAMEFGTITESSSNGTLRKVKIISNQIVWDNTNHVGLRVFGAQRARFYIDSIAGFTIGYECYSSSAGYSYCYHQILHLIRNKYQMALTCDGNGDNNYVNENIFMGGRYANNSSVDTYGSSYGVLLREINNGYQNHNNNRWFSPCFELQEGEVGDERIPFLFDNVGQKNTVYNARHETGRGPFAKMDGTTYAACVQNSFEANTQSSSGLALPTVEQLGSASLNTYTPVGTIKNALVESKSFDVVKAVKSFNGTGSASISNGLSVGASSSATPFIATDLKQKYDSVSIRGTRLLGFFLEVDGQDMFTIGTKVAQNKLGRIGVNVYDENFNILDNTSASYPDVIGLTYTSSYGKGYRRGSDGDFANITLSSAVRYMRVWVSGGTDECWLKSISITRVNPANKTMMIFSGLDTSDSEQYASAIPTDGEFGTYNKGQIINHYSPSAGATSYWQCTTSGRLAAAWLTATIYELDDVVLSNTDKIYRCVTAGTSSSAPTGTGSGIVDGTVVWDYVSPKAEFATGPNLT